MKKPIGAMLHFNHFILYYEDEKGSRSYRLLDDKANTIATYDETEKDGKRVPADIATAMKVAKRRFLVEEAGQALAELDAVDKASAATVTPVAGSTTTTTSKDKK